MPPKLPESELKKLGDLLRMSTSEMKALVREGVIVQSSSGSIDTAQSLLAISRHLLATRSTAEAKARAAEADAALKEHRLKAATRSVKEDTPTGRGRWSKAAGERICKAVQNGSSLRAAAKAEGLTAAAVLKWKTAHPEFGKQYAQACELKYHGYADEMDEALEEADQVARDPECGSTRLAAIRLRIDTRKWQLAKMLPKIYGDRTIAQGDEHHEGVRPSEQMEELVRRIGEQQARIMMKITKGEEE